MSEDLDREFDRADLILSDALQRFQSEGVSQYVYAMALLEIGVVALARLDESEGEIIDTVRRLYAKSTGQGALPEA